MIQPGTILNVADNSGAKKINCITVLGGYKKATAGVGDVVVASVREMKRRIKGQVFKVQKGQVVHCVIVRTRKERQNSSGFLYASAKNAGVLIDATSKNPIGTRVLGPITDELKKSGFGKIVNMSSLSAL
jgi:large subunit ribosomal protein L14